MNENTYPMYVVDGLRGIVNMMSSYLDNGGYVGAGQVQALDKYLEQLMVQRERMVRRVEESGQEPA